LALAALWATGLIAAAATVPAYSGSSSATLVEVNGGKVLGVVAVPLVLVLIAGLSLQLRIRKGVEGAGAAAWIAVGLLHAFTVVSAFTIGKFVFPVLVLLACACAAASVRSGRTSRAI
jgi:hypothetical protein